MFSKNFRVEKNIDNRVKTSLKSEADEKVQYQTVVCNRQVQTKDIVCDVPKKQVFIPGGIHKLEAVEFWRSELKANQWVMTVLEHGYVIPFAYAPAEYDEDNNMSAKKQMGFVRQSVNELKSAGIVKFVEEKPWCVSPLTVSEKIEPDGTKKLRLCWDGSRCVNLCLKEQKLTASS